MKFHRLQKAYWLQLRLTIFTWERILFIIERIGTGTVPEYGAGKSPRWRNMNGKNSPQKKA